MTQEQRNEVRIRQLEASVLHMQKLIQEQKSEIEALGEVIVVTAASLDKLNRGALLERLRQAADAQRGLHHVRTANALESVIASAEVEGKPQVALPGESTKLEA